MMNFERLAEELKKARLEKHISLMDISAETRINIKFLEAIEQGKFSILPQTYVRAFLREYALSVGANPDEILKSYDEARGEHPAAPAESARKSPRPVAQPVGSSVGMSSRAAVIRMALFGAVVLGGVLVFLLSNNSGTPVQEMRPTAEVSFDRVVKETEAATIPPRNIVRDTLPAAAAVADSLRLQIVTTDSVWLSILIDGKKTEEYLFPPRRKKMWVAKDRFAVTMGNAGGATFQLNGKELGALGKRGAVLRNAVLTEATLRTP